LGFAATDFVLTKTLSTADAAAHLVTNPHWPLAVPNDAEKTRQAILVTSFLLVLLGASFLRGFREVITLAVVIVFTYMVLSAVVIGAGVGYLVEHPQLFHQFVSRLESGDWYLRDRPLSGTGLLTMLAISFIIFPKLALGLSGFETGVAVMPLVQGDPGDTAANPSGRIRGARRLLLTAALIMSVALLGSSVVTALLIPKAEFLPGGLANGRALAYLAHEHFGEWFGTLYDVSTIGILWFAGASAMAGLLNLVPRYLPRFGMAPEWAKAMRPLVLVFTAITFFVTIMFQADVEAQGGAYATGVLVLMTSAALAVMLAAYRTNKVWQGYLLITLVFAYTTIDNILQRPEGLRIAMFFIGAIVVTSLVSRVLRSTELRIQGVDTDDAAALFIDQAATTGQVRVIANRPGTGNVAEYAAKIREARETHQLKPWEPVLFVEVATSDASDFSNVLQVRGVEIGPFRVLRSHSPAIPNAIAGLLLHIRERTGKVPHAYFGWTEGNPIAYLLKFLAFGEGDVAPVTREVLRQTEPDPERRPRIHLG
jgi:hypothetical protein